MLGLLGIDVCMNRSNEKVYFHSSIFTNCLLMTMVTERALAFSMRSNTFTASSALQTWRQVHASHRNAFSFAVHYRFMQLRFKMLLTWRIALRVKLKMVKQGRTAEKFFVTRRAWKAWMDKLEEKRTEKKLKDLERQRMQKYFLGKYNRHPSFTYFR